MSWADPQLSLMLRPFDAAFMAKVEKTATCWLWTGEILPNGYGRYWNGGDRVVAHRFSYEMFVGPIPEGLQLDHVRARGCTSRRCVNPEHLEAVTPLENTARSTGPASRTHCPSGHEYTPENTRVYQGRRYCRACNNNGGEARLTTGSRGGDPAKFRAAIKARELLGAGT